VYFLRLKFNPRTFRRVFLLRLTGKFNLWNILRKLNFLTFAYATHRHQRSSNVSESSSNNTCWINCVHVNLINLNLNPNMVSKNVSDGKRYLAKIGRDIIHILLLFSILRLSLKTKRALYTGQITSGNIFISSELITYLKDYTMSGNLPVMLFLESTICLAIVGIATVWTRAKGERAWKRQTSSVPIRDAGFAGGKTF
jgi:hypothetical protein